MKIHSIEALAQAQALLRQGLALGLQDLAHGRAELAAAASQFAQLGHAPGQVLACAAQVLFMGVADDDYRGFEAAIAVLSAHDATPPAEPDAEPDDEPAAEPDDDLLVQAGMLVAASFNALDAPGLAERAAALEQSLADTRLPAPLRCCAGLAALGYQHIGMQLEKVLWLELALRPLLSDVAVSASLADEAVHLLIQSLYQCEAPAQAQALRQRHFAPTRTLLPVMALKLALLDAQMALGAGRSDAGRAALTQAQAWLDPRAPRPAGWWHLLHSRLDLLDGRHRQALTHARLALRLASQSQLPERWMGVTVMQEGQVLMASKQCQEALPFFERAGRAASGQQARFCWCLAHLARALHAADDDAKTCHAELAAGLSIARELAWLNFFRACPPVAARVCALALEAGIDVAFVQEVIQARQLQAVRADLDAWPWPIRVRTLGSLRIELQGQPLVFRGKVAKKPLELLLFVVASSGVDVSITTACFAVWPELEGDKARAAFTAALHRLRKLLGSDDALLLEHGRLSLNPRTVWVDCLAFEQLAASVGVPAAGALTSPLHSAAQRACALYSGAFMHDAQDAAWQLSYRNRLASTFKRMVRLISAAARARGDSANARAWLERGLEQDPLAEDLARELMRECLEAGDQAAALRVFEQLQTAMTQHLGAPLAPATLALHAQIRAATPR